MCVRACVRLCVCACVRVKERQKVELTFFFLFLCVCVCVCVCVCNGVTREVFGVVSSSSETFARLSINEFAA